MRPEPPPEPQPGIAEPHSAQIVAGAAAEEEAPTGDWTIAPTPIPPDTGDAELVALWLHGKSPNTVRAYGDDVAAFRRYTGKPLRATYLSDLQRYADSLVGAPATRGRRLKSLKSLLSFAPGWATCRSTPAQRSADRRSSRSSPSESSANAKSSRCSRRSKIGRATTP